MWCFSHNIIIEGEMLFDDEVKNQISVSYTKFYYYYHFAFVATPGGAQRFPVVCAQGSLLMGHSRDPYWTPVIKPRSLCAGYLTHYIISFFKIILHNLKK